MEEKQQDKPNPSIPFNNLYLLSGLVNGSNKWWMYLGTLLLLMLGYVSFQLMSLYPLIEVLKGKGYTEAEIAANTTLLFDSSILGLDLNVILLIELGMFVFAFMGFMIGLRSFHHKTLVSVFTGYEKFRWKRFYFGFAVWAGLILLSTLISYFLNPEDLHVKLNWQGLLLSVLIMVTLMPIQTGLEEVLFRGYLLQGLSLLFKNGITPLILTSMLFATAHMTNPEVKEYGAPIMFTYYACFALFMGGISLLDEGLELAFGIHLANNLVSSILISTPTSVIKTYSVFEASKGDAYSEMLLWCVMSLLTFVIFWMRYKWKNFSLIIK